MEPRIPAALQRIRGVEVFGNNIYITRENSLAKVFGALNRLGFVVDESDYDRDIVENPDPVARSYADEWFATLDDDKLVYVECLHCHRVFKEDTLTHDYKCPHCGEVIFLWLMPGSTVEFCFQKGYGARLQLALTGVVEHFDINRRLMSLRYDSLTVTSLFHKKLPSVETVLARNEGNWRVTTMDGIQLFTANWHYMPEPKADPTWIHILGIKGQYRQFRSVRKWRGRDYPVDGPFPVFSAIHLYEAWRWSRLAPGPDLWDRVFAAVGVWTTTLDRAENEPCLNTALWQEMRRFIEHFTTLDVKQWDKLSRGLPNDKARAFALVQEFCSGNSSHMAD